LMPIALPPRSRENASVRIALELANRNAPPTPWPIRMKMIHRAPSAPFIQVNDNRMEKTVKTANPRLYIFTRRTCRPPAEADHEDGRRRA